MYYYLALHIPHPNGHSYTFIEDYPFDSITAAQAHGRGYVEAYPGITFEVSDKQSYLSPVPSV